VYKAFPTQFSFPQQKITQKQAFVCQDKKTGPAFQQAQQ
jgi:hypothetical protein